MFKIKGKESIREKKPLEVSSLLPEHSITWDLSFK